MCPRPHAREISELPARLFVPLQFCWRNVSLHTLDLDLHLKNWNWNELVLIWTYVMYVYSTCWSKEENRNKSQQKWCTEHCWPSALLLSSRAPVCVSNVVFMVFRYWCQYFWGTAELRASTEEPLTTYVQPLEPSVANRSHWVHILHPYQYAF